MLGPTPYSVLGNIFKTAWASIWAEECLSICKASKSLIVTILTLQLSVIEYERS